MKTITLSTKSEIWLIDTNELTAYPIQSIEGADGVHGRGWIARRVTEPTVIIDLSPIDAMSGGCAVPLERFLSAFDLENLESVRACSRLDGELLAEREERILHLEREIGKLNDKIAKMKKGAAKR